MIVAVAALALAQLSPGATSNLVGPPSYVFCLSVPSSSPVQQETIAEIRVHGNATLTDSQVIALAGVTIVTPLTADDLQAIERRLRDSGRFDEVEVRKRYRTLAMDEIALVLLVHERPGVTASGNPPTIFRQIRSRLMFLPILHYEEGYGWTYGGRTSTVDLFGGGERLSVPLSWGGTRRAALDAERTFKSGPLTRVAGSFGISRRENPHFLVADRRTAVTGRAERRLFGLLTLGAEAGRSAVTFADVRGHLWTTGADVTLDTRNDPAFPSNSFLAGFSWNRLHQPGVAPIDRYRLDGRGYWRLVGQAVLAVRAEYDVASAPVPAYEQWLLGGESLRGARAGTFAGDTRLVTTTEIRMPFSTPLSTARAGFIVFFDAGTDVLHGTRLRDASISRGAGAGVFIVAPLVRLNLDLAHSLNGYGTRVHFRTGFTF